MIRTALIIVVFISVLTMGFSEPQTPNQRSEGNSGVHALPGWILDMNTVGALIVPFENFYLMNNRFPHDLKELLDSGLIMVWPAYPPTGKPMKLVEEIEPSAEYLDKIAYIWKSDKEAYLQYVVYLEEKNEFNVINFPPKFISDKFTSTDYLSKHSDVVPLQAQTFHSMMNALYSATILHDEYIQAKTFPQTVEETVRGNFFWIKENMTPDFLSASPDDFVFYEWGIADLGDTPVAFYQFTLPIVSKEGYVQAANYVDIVSLEGLNKINDDNWDMLTNKKYIYSSEQLVNGTFSVSDEILITKEQILNPE